MEYGVCYIENRSANSGAENIDNKIYKRSSLTVGAGSESAEHYRYRSTDPDTHKYRECHVELYSSCHSKCLKDTYGSTRTLDHCSDQETYQNTQDRIREACQHFDESRFLSQRSDRA
jgi:hypothetical protein